MGAECVETTMRPPRYNVKRQCGSQGFDCWPHPVFHFRALVGGVRRNVMTYADRPQDCPARNKHARRRPPFRVCGPCSLAAILQQLRIHLDRASKMESCLFGMFRRRRVRGGANPDTNQVGLPARDPISVASKPGGTLINHNESKTQVC